jgi:hypothetical protein
MATYEIAGKTYEIDGELTPEIVKSLMPASNPPSDWVTDPLMKTGMSVAEEILQGLSANTSDELQDIAASQSAVGFAGMMGGPSAAFGLKHQLAKRGMEDPPGAQPGATREAINARQGEFRDANFVSSIGLNIAGGVAGGPGMLASKASPLMSSALGRWGTGIGVGTAYGAGGAEPGERMETGAGIGALTAGILGLQHVGGAVVDTAKPLVSSAVRKVGDKLFPPPGPGRQAKKVFDEAGVDATALAAQGQSKTALASQDAGLLKFAQIAVKSGGKAANEAAEALVAAGRGAKKRVKEILRQTAGSSNNAKKVREISVDARRTTAKPLYDRAYQQNAAGVAGDKALQNLWRGLGKSLRRDVIELAKTTYLADTGKKMPNKWLGKDVQLTTQAWDYVQQALGKMTYGGFSAGGARTASAEATGGIRARILDRLSELVPSYGVARAHYKDSMDVNRLIDLGFKMATNPKPSAVAREVSQIQKSLGRTLDLLRNPADRELVIMGLAEGLEDLASRSADDAGAALSRSLSKDNIRQVLRDTLGGDLTDELFERITREVDFAGFAKAVAKSVDGGKMSRVQSLTDDVAVADKSVSTWLKRRLGRVSPDAMDDIGAALLSTEPHRRLRLLRQVMDATRTKDFVQPRSGTNPIPVGIFSQRVQEEYNR